MINGLLHIKSICRITLDRVELYGKLLAIEAKIERNRLARRIAWAGCGAIFAIFAIAVLHMLIMSYFWQGEHRSLAISIVLAVDILIAATAFFIASRPSPEEPLAVTKHQLAEDLKFIKESL